LFGADFAFLLRAWSPPQVMRATQVRQMITYPLVLCSFLFHLSSAFHKKGQYTHPAVAQLQDLLKARARRMSSMPNFGNGGATYQSFEEIISGVFLISGDIPDSLFNKIKTLTTYVLEEIAQVDVAITSVDVLSRGPGQSVTLSFSYMFMPRVSVFQTLVEAGDGDSNGLFHSLLDKAARHWLQGFDTSEWHIVSANTKEDWLWVRKPVPALMTSRSTSTVTTTLTTSIVEHASSTSEPTSMSTTQVAMTTSTSVTTRLASEVAALSTTTWSQVTDSVTHITTRPPPLPTTSSGEQGTRTVSRIATTSLRETSGSSAEEFDISKMALILILIGAFAVITMIVAACIAGRSVGFRAAATTQTPILVKRIGRMFSRGDLDFAWDEGNLGFPHGHEKRSQGHAWPEATHGKNNRIVNAPPPPCQILKSAPQPPGQCPKLDTEPHCISHHARPQRSSLEVRTWANSPVHRIYLQSEPPKNVGLRCASHHSPRREEPRFAGTSSPHKCGMTAGTCPNCIDV